MLRVEACVWRWLTALVVALFASQDGCQHLDGDRQSQQEARQWRRASYPYSKRHQGADEGEYVDDFQVAPSLFCQGGVPKDFAIMLLLSQR